MQFMAMSERRRDAVTRREFDELVRKVDRNVELTEENTIITKDVRDLLASFKVMAHIGKWVTVIATMCAAVAAAWHSITKGT